MDLFQLVGTIAINNAEANSQIDQTTEKASSFGSKLASGIGTVAKWGTAVVAGATVAGTALVKFASESASTADHIDKMSQKIGISRQAYQELDFICSQSGTSVDGLQAGVKSLTSAMDGARDGVEKNVAQFERLGVSVTNADGTFRSQEDVLYDTISALQGMDDQTEKARLATELFGRSGTELMPLLNSEAGSMEEMKNQAHELGLVLGDELIDNGVELNDSLDQTKRAFSSIATNLGASLMPIVTKVSDYIQKSLPTIQGMVDRIAPVITGLLESVLPPLMSLAEQIFPVVVSLIEMLLPPTTEIVQQVLPIIVDLLNMLLPPCMQIITAFLPIAVSLIQALLPLLNPILMLLQPLIDLIVILLDPLVLLLTTILPPLISVITFLVETITSFLMPILDALSLMLGDVLGVAFTTIANLISAVVAVITGDWETAQQKLNEIWENIKALGEALWNGLIEFFGANLVATMELFSTIWSTISTFAQNIWTAMKAVGEAIWNAVKDYFTNTLNNIKTLFETIWNAIKTANDNVMNTIRTVIQTIWEAIKSFITNTLNNIKTITETVFNAIKNTITNILNAIKNTFNTVWNAIKTAVTNVINNIRTGMNNGMNNIHNSATNILNKIKNTFVNVFNGIKNYLNPVLTWLKNIFNFSWSLPHISLPHFSVSGSFSINPPSVPSFDVSWYKKAMEDGMIMNSPTIFGYDQATNKFMAGGEAGSETVVGTQNLMGMIQEAVNGENSVLIDFFTRLIELLEDFFPQVLEGMNFQMVLDTGALVGETAPMMDEELGTIYKRKGRQ